ncbi:MAG: transcription termination factor, partial [Alistipes sp.]|nr:transcription termination factor [Alistipes sp.]
MLSRRLLRIKVVKALYAHFKSESDSLITSEKNLTASVDKTYDLYNQLLWLIVEVKRYAESRIELAKSKKLPTKEDLNPNTRFIDNQMIRQIEESDKLNSYLEKKSLGWVRYPE